MLDFMNRRLRAAAQSVVGQRLHQACVFDQKHNLLESLGCLTFLTAPKVSPTPVLLQIGRLLLPWIFARDGIRKKWK